MKKQIGKLLQRIRRKSQSARVDERKKQLRLEALEGRRLLSADGLSPDYPHHNSFVPEDVDFNFTVTARDALIALNQLNKNTGFEEIPDGQQFGETLPDVNADNQLTALDVLRIFNRLSNGEAEGTPTAVYSYAVVDNNGTPITNNQVAVGDQFQVQAFIRDTRGFTATGINAAFVDIGFDNDAAFDVAVGEIQQFQFFFDQLDTSDTTSAFTMTFQGQTTNPIPLFNNGNPRSDVNIAENIQSELEGLSNVGVGNVRAIVDSVARNNDLENMVNRFSFEIRFANDLAGQNLDLITVDGSNVAVNPGQTWVNVVNPVLDGDQSTPQAEAQAIVFDDLYNFSRLAEVTATGFNDVGAASQTIPLPNPGEAKLLFTIPMIAVAPGTINFTPAFPDNSPTTDTVAGTTTIPSDPNPDPGEPMSMVDFGAAFQVTVISDPTAPVANNDTLTVNENVSVTLNGNVTNNDTFEPGRTLSVLSAATTGGTQGTLNGLTYQAPADFVGTDTITYIAQDSTGLTSNTATVTINIVNVNDAPTAVNDSFEVDEDSTGNVLDVLANDLVGPNDVGDTLTIVAASTAGTGTVSFTGGNNLTYTPAIGFIGTETLSYTIEDSGGLQSTATVTVTVAPATLPRARTDLATVDEDQSVDIDVLANDSANVGATATLVSLDIANIPENGSIQINQNGTADLTDDTIIYTPIANFNGTDVFTYIMNDTAGTGENSIGTVTVTVNDVNDAPVLANDTANATEDVTATIAASTLLANDSPGPGEGAGTQNPQTLTIISVGSVTNGAGSVALDGNGDVVYTPTADFNGQFTFTYTAEDSGTPALSDTATVTVTVAAVNDAPVATDDTRAGTEDTDLVITEASILANDSPGPADEAGQTLSVTGVSGSSANGGTVSRANGEITYSPAADFNGQDTFTYTVSDGEDTATGTVTINVAAVNDPPIAGDDSASGFSQQGIVLNVADLLANDSPGPANESGQTLSIVAVTPTVDTNGTVVLNGDTITYTPTDGFAGTATFEYTLEDSEGSQDTGLVTLDVQSFTPSTIGGTVWVDETNDGIIDAAERELGAVIVTLTGTALGEAIAPQSVMTLSDGSYSFGNLAPGTYTISMTMPHFFRDGMDVPGALGDMDSIENQFTVHVAEPGGVADAGYNFGLIGLDSGYSRPLDQLASQYIISNPDLAYNGAYFAVGADNSLLWSAKLDGFSDAMFAEAVFEADGDLLLSFVDDNGAISTAVLGRGEFVRVTDAGGNALIRILGAASQFDFQRVSMAAPPFEAARYLDSIDAIFDQEGWEE